MMTELNIDESLIEVIESEQAMSIAPCVSVWILTHNHNKFIRQAIDSVLMQKTDFDIEIVLVDDFSSDGTRDAVIEYQERFPDKFRLRLARKNLFHLGFTFGINGLDACRGKYIALLEGDDYWLDEYKLQKQVGFLESNPDFAVCIHRVKMLWETDDLNMDQPDILTYDKSELTTLDALRNNGVSPWPQYKTHTASSVFRANVIQHKLPPGSAYVCNGDQMMFLWASLHGRTKVLDDVMSVWRRHDDGLSIRRMREDSPREHADRHINLFLFFKSFLPVEYHDECDYIIAAHKRQCALGIANLNTQTAKRQLSEYRERYLALCWRVMVAPHYSRIALFGAGIHTEQLLDALRNHNLFMPVLIIDSAPKTNMLFGLPVVMPEEMHRNNFDAIVLSTNCYQREMIEIALKLFGPNVPIIDLYNSTERQAPCIQTLQ